MAWNALKEEFGDDGFEVMAVPSNNFGLQEPGNNGDLLNGIKHVRPGGGFEPNYRVCGKSDVNGARENAMYTYFKAHCAGAQQLIADTEQMYWSPVRQTDITWNYEKFLIDHEGHPFRRYVPAMNPQNPTIRSDIQELLARKKAADEAAATKEETTEESNKTIKKSKLSEIIKAKLHH